MLAHLKILLTDCSADDFWCMIWSILGDLSSRYFSACLCHGCWQGAASNRVQGDEVFTTIMMTMMMMMNITIGTISTMINITIGTIIKLSTGRRPFQESVFLSDDLCPRTKTSWFSGKSHLFLIEESPHPKLDKKLTIILFLILMTYFRSAGTTPTMAVG